MRSGVYRWDVAELSRMITKLSNEKEKLETDSKNIEKFKQEIEGSWQSIAGTGYTSTVDVDARDIKFVIDRLTETIDKLRKVSQYYSNGETEVQNRVNLLSTQILR